MTQINDIKVIESELSVCQHLNWVLDNIYQNYKQGFSSIKELLIMLKSGQEFNDNNKYQLEHYDNMIASVENNIALWENQYDMFDGYYRTSFNNHPQRREQNAAFEYEDTNSKTSFNTNLDVKPCICTNNNPINESINSEMQEQNFDSDWLNDDIYYMKSLELTPPLMDQMIGSTLREDMVDNGFDSSLSMNNEINDIMISSLVAENDRRHDLNANASILQKNQCHDSIKTFERISQTENGGMRKRKHNVKNLKQVESRIWYKCAWEGCSFGSFYNGVVKRHSYKKHSGQIRIDKSSNSRMHRFKCDWPGCEVSLVAYHKLVEHKRKHTGEKPFKCKWRNCNYATARLYSMIIHERTHKLESSIE